jgi:hypothetical protein
MAGHRPEQILQPLQHAFRSIEEQAQVEGGGNIPRSCSCGGVGIPGYAVVEGTFTVEKHGKGVGIIYAGPE